MAPDADEDEVDWSDLLVDTTWFVADGRSEPTGAGGLGRLIGSMLTGCPILC
jgi:hypothetical protein